MADVAKEKNVGFASSFESPFLKNISVIVPFTKDDLLWKDLLQDLKVLPKEAEILLVGPDMPDTQILKRATETMITPVRYVKSLKGRALQMNCGAKSAGKDYFWFLHADTKVPRPSIFLLDKSMQNDPQALHFFNLQFLADGPKIVNLNAVVANLRSRFLGMPFGDQGFAMSRATFLRIGGFPQNESYGEDHALVWEAKRKRIRLNNVPATIFTSARRYEQEGWGLVTRTRLHLTFKQALREYFKLVKQRLVERHYLIGS